MKKLLFNFGMLCIFTAACISSASAQQRYVDDVFTDITKISNIEYDSNRSVNILYGSVPGQLPLITVKLLCDIYSPALVDDTISERPVVLVVSTGSYLPPIVNNQVTGSKNDSSIVELCTRLAKKGYVAVALNYRQGWNPTTTVQADASEQLIKATFRGIQDVRNCVRFLRVNSALYGIDTSKIIVGGQGTGGYVALAIASVDKRSEIEDNPKFQRGDFTPMVSVDTLGDWMGLGGVALPAYPFYYNYSGDPAVPANVHMVFNYGGAIGDSTWLDAASMPIVGLHSTTDPFAPYRTGNVIVPTTGLTVIPSASGAGALVPYANSIGINNKINDKIFSDAYTTRALQASGNVKNLFPFIIPPGGPAGDGAPWEWWDRATVQAITSVTVNGVTIPANGRNADSLSMLTNPTMSAAKGKAYIDTVVNFIAPRIAAQLDLATFNTSIKEVASLSGSLNVYPNPAKTNINVSLPVTIKQVNIFDITGKEIFVTETINAKAYQLDLSTISPGMYFINVTATDGRSAVKRIVVE